jgi:hypothetical protein
VRAVLDRALRALLIVVTTVAVLEWSHYRLGEPSFFALLLGEPRAESPTETAEGDDADNVTESDFQSYLRVLEAMQADHSLAVEDAAVRGDLTLEEFREVESRVQRNDVLVERTREALRKKAESLWDRRRAALEHG